jgi:hypothetical protein
LIHLRIASHYKTALLLLAAAALVTNSCGNRIVLDERFFDNRLLNWTVVDDPGTIEGPSRWRVEEDGWVHQRSNIWGRRGDFLNRWYGTYLVAGNASWRDYSFYARCRAEDDDGFGVVFRYRDMEHFYRLILIRDSLNGGAITRLDRRDGGDYAELWNAPHAYNPGEELNLHIHVKGPLIEVRMDEAILCSVTDATYESGGIGLFCYAQNGQAFDDIRVLLD